MKIVYAHEPFPDQVQKTIFLAGPSPRGESDANWRPAALKMLEELGFDGHVFVPLPRDGVWSNNYDGQVAWEEEGLHRADCIVFWVPRDQEKLPGFTTNDEWGYWKDSGKVVWGAPPQAHKVRYQSYYAKKFGAPAETTLRETLSRALTMIGPGADRQGGECQVPLLIWNHKTFQGWYRRQVEAGNRLDGARVLWTFRVGPTRQMVLAFTLRVNVFVASENRNKKNEFVFGRTDLAAAVLWSRGSTLGLSRIAMVREFRSPARTSDGMIHELPSGSSKNTEEATRTVIAKEIEEELGLKVNPENLQFFAERQMAGTLSIHTASLFSLQLSNEEMDKLATVASEGKSFGVESETERTYVEVRTVENILADTEIDWATVGMVASIFYAP
jgi:ADP-ribose pyrophosphatase YjhB (NUDIX family)